MAKNLNFAQEAKKRSILIINSGTVKSQSALFWNALNYSLWRKFLARPQSALAPSLYNFNSLISGEKEEEQKNVNEHKRQNEKNRSSPPQFFYRISHPRSYSLNLREHVCVSLGFSRSRSSAVLGERERERERERRPSVCLSVCLFQKKKLVVIMSSMVGKKRRTVPRL